MARPPVKVPSASGSPDLPLPVAADADAAERAFAVAYPLLLPGMLLYARGRFRRDDVEDAVQNAFASLVTTDTGRKTLERTAGNLAELVRYLHAALRNLASNARRNSMTEWKGLTGLFRDMASWFRESPDPERAWLLDARKRHLDAALATLTPRVAQAFFLRRTCRLPAAEVARRMQIAESTVHSLVHQASGQIQDAFHAAAASDPIARMELEDLV